MKWINLLVKLVSALLKPPRQRPAERHSTIPSVRPLAGRLPLVTRDMIEPRNKVLTRYGIAEAYRDFYIAHFELWNGHEVQMAYNEIIGSYVSHIEECERNRDELMPRLKQARYELHEMRRLYAAEGPESDKNITDRMMAEAEATLARRLKRVAAADTCIADLKADAREFFVSFLNEKIQDHNNHLS